MQIIISHVNTDFDALASMFAAKKLYPDAQVVISDKQNIPVSQFLTIYRDKLDLVQDKLVDWPNITEIILVDEASLSRVGNYTDQLDLKNLTITVYDHHPVKEIDVTKDKGNIELVGAAVTLLIEEIKQKLIPITPFEATLFGLGIYTDTGSFTFTNTTARDFEAASYLMRQGMNLELVHRFSNEIIMPEQQDLLNHLFEQSTVHHIAGLQIVVSAYDHRTFQKGLASLTQKLLEITDADAALSIVNMKNRIFIVGRASSDRINLQPLLHKWNGGGHAQAGSASVKNSHLTTVLNDVIESLDVIIQPAITARDIMTYPVKTILPETSIEESGHLMFRYGHSGFPVVKDQQLVGIITRRDLEKANHHGLGHAPVKAYMTTNVVSIPPEMTEEEIQQKIIERNIGRLPVVENNKLIGIVSRTNIIESMHHKKTKEQEGTASPPELLDNVQPLMKQQLPAHIYRLLSDISDAIDPSKESAYLIGGIVRDLLLEKDNDDVDIVIEGNGIEFARTLQQKYGGKVIVHESFQTATWTHPNGLEIDITTSRLEYYNRPAALPDVETSTLQEDIHRRDFTINAMAINLNKDTFGQLIDPYLGQQDLIDKTVRILHNISFIEDPTRIFRGVRFEMRFDFHMDEQTEQLALHSIARIKDLSVNRIVHEMERLLTVDYPAKTIQRLFELQFWQQYEIEEGKGEASYQHADRLHTMVTELPHVNLDWYAYFFIPFYQEGNIVAAKRFALTKQAMKLLEELGDLTNEQQWKQVQNVGELHRFLKDYSDEVILFITANLNHEQKQLIIHYLIQRYQLPTFLTGADLIKEGLKPSKLFSTLLLDLDVAVLNGEITSKKAAIEWVQQQIKT